MTPKSHIYSATDVSRPTILREIRKLVTDDGCPFTYSEYRNRKVIPNSWANFIADRLLLNLS